MKKYDLTDEEKNLLKVAKMNQDLSEGALQELSTSHKTIENDLSSNEAFLNDIENKLNINNHDVDVKTSEYVKKQTISDWDTLVEEANDIYQDNIGFEDLLNSSDFMNAYNKIDDINAQFKKQTGLSKIDVMFLITAIALQCTRQYVLDPWLKSKRSGASSNDEMGRKNNAEPGWYYASTDSILTNRVPFDCNKYAGKSTIEGFLKGSKNHRMATLGHDPMLGWVFGTANIMTNTMTRNDFQSAHIKNIGGENMIYAKANTGRIFEEVSNRFIHEGVDGKLALGCAILREFLHLKSDINTKLSLPLPAVSVVSPQFADKLSKYGIDMAGVGSEIGLSVLINTIISMVHGLMYDESIDRKLYEVRTRKILLYSNCIATTSNVIIAYIKKDPKMLDVGGLIVTIIRLFSDIRFITKVKEDFINSKIGVSFNGIADELDAMYNDYYDDIILST